MNITIQIPADAVADVVKYCLKEGIDLQGRMQQELDTFVNNAREQMEQRRQIKGEQCQP